MKKQNKVSVEAKQKGITLIALIITIIVLLILAGVTINLTLGENGIFKTAQLAAKNYTNAQEKELAGIAEFNNTLNNTINGLGQNNNEAPKIQLNGAWSTKNKVNMPKLVNTGLSPVTISGTDGALTTVSDEDIQNELWYSYDGTNNKWANAKTKDGSMWVWIPRFAYKITYTNANDKSAGGTIDVVFLQNDTNKDANGNDVTLATYKDEKGNTGAYIVHPAFRDGSANGLNNGYANGEWDDEISGFWMAKFEAGYAGTAGNANTATDSNVSLSTVYSWHWNGSDWASEDYTTNYYGTREVGTKLKYPAFQANKASMNYIPIADAYNLCMDLKNGSSVYGLANIDSHLTKNSEWGAVAYLTHSKYGRNGTEVTINNMSVNNSTESIYAVTGYAGETVSASEEITMLAKVQNGEQAGSWLTSRGQTASSTGNIYGIYDLSGGTFEWTAGYIAIGDNYNTYGGPLKGDSSKYKTKYAYSGDGATDTSNYSMSENQARIGDAIAETSNGGGGSSAWTNSWNRDTSLFPCSVNPFFGNGGGWGNTSRSGVFAFDHHSGLRHFLCWVPCGARCLSRTLTLGTGFYPVLFLYHKNVSK